MDEQHREEIALFRFGLVFPVLNGPLKHGDVMRHFEEVIANRHQFPHSGKTEISLSTLKRWRARYLKGGFKALKPKPRSDRGKPRVISEKILSRACQLRRENPKRSVARIIEMLELNGDIRKGALKRSTLSRHLRKRGLSRQALRDTEEGPYRRFEAKGPNVLWQSDVKYGPYLPDPSGKDSRIRTYLIGFLDDFSRRVVHAEFYWHQDLVSLADCCKKALIRAGLPESIYVDHGKIYISSRFQASAAELGIYVMTGKTYHPEGRGKIERLWGELANSFLSELNVTDTTTLAGLNDYLEAWIEQHHNQRIHSETEQAPNQRFAQYLDDPRITDKQQLDQAFLWRDKRKVQKTATISLEGNRYEVDPALIGRQVTLYYDPINLEKIQVYHEGVRYADAEPMDLSTDHHPDVAQRPQEEAPSTGLNYLELLKKKHQAQRRSQLGQMQYHKLREADM
jgi:putative transposase